MQELIVILIIALILWPVAVIGAVKWLIRHSFGQGPSGDAAPEADGAEPEDPNRGST